MVRIVSALVLFGCGGASHVAADASGGSDAATDASSVDAAVSPLALACAATTGGFAPNPCPAPSGAHGHADLCFRPQWPGVTAVEVYGGFHGDNTDWTAPFLALTDDGSGTFTGSAALADGTYPYLFRVHGSADNLVKDGQYLLDQTNAAFVAGPPQAPIQRSVSNLVIPQPATALHHVTGKVMYGGIAQPCFSVDLEVGEILDSQHRPLSEHYTASFAESAADGTFDFPVADGHVMTVVRFPFRLAGATAPYPDPATTPSIGYARQGFDIAGADHAVETLDVMYAAADYAAMSPTSGTATLPVTFAYDLVPGATTVSVAVIGTNIAGNDPAYWSKYGTATTLTWNGTLGNGTQATLGTTYYWGTWQKSSTWSSESLLFPIAFH